MENKKKSFASGINVGSSSILVTFVLLCLVTFAALSFVSANADNKLALKIADRTKVYYAANNTAEIYLLNADSLLSKHYEDCSNSKEYFDGVNDLFIDNDSAVVEVSGDDTYINFYIEMSDSQQLDVSLKVVYPDSVDQDMFEITRWETVSTYIPEEETLQEETGSFLF